MSGGERSSPLDALTADEVLVAQILLDLPDIIRDNNSCSIFKWGGKRRRSRIDDAAPSSRAPNSRPPPPVEKIEARKSKSKSAAKGEDDAAAASPITPLSFAPSETDEKKSRHGFKKNCRRSREEYSDLIEELTQRRDLLKTEIVNVTKYYNKLKSYNSELKAVKQEVLNSCHEKKEPKIDKNVDMNREVELNSNFHYQFSVGPQQQLLVSRGPVTAQFYPSGDGLGSVRGVGLLGIPDLNISSGEACRFDSSGPFGAIGAQADRRARFAEARRLRKGIIKIKSMRRACGVKLPTTRWHS